MRVVSVSSSRADVGILAPVWRALTAKHGVDLHVFLTGMHQAKPTSTVPEVPERAVVHRGGADLGGVGDNRASDAMASITRAAGELFATIQPDAVLVTGDRLDMLPAAMASLPFNIPLLHLHGGEVTEGAIDDRIRHAISKLAHWHCVASENAKARLLAIGEPEERITVTGAPGLDTLLAAPAIPDTEFARRTGLPQEAAFRLVTVHPETNAADPLAPMSAVLTALEARPGLTLFTAPNSDPGGADARRRIDAFVAKFDWAVFQDTLGPDLYPDALCRAAVMLGNSSSGVIEAGLFGLPVVNVGDRQKGRERGANVIDVPNDSAAVIAALDQLESEPKRFEPGTPYGDGQAGPKVAAAIVRLHGAGGEMASGSPRMEEAG